MARTSERLRRSIATSGIAAAAALGGCIAAPPHRLASRAPDTAAVRAAAESPPAAARPSTIPGPAERPVPRSLGELVDLALSRDPSTRAAWHDARAAAAQDALRLAAFVPSVDLALSRTRQRTPPRGAVPAFEATTWGPSATATWILLDLGALSAARESDRLLAAANLAHRAAVLDLVLQVEQTHYQHLAARALVAAEQAAVKQAQTSLAAAEGRRRAGLATIADVLQARTALSQAQLLLQQYEGQALALRGALATLAGLPPTAPLDMGELPSEVAVSAALPAVEDLIAQAEAANPDLTRAQALADAAGAHADAVGRSYLLPSVVAQGSWSWSRYTPSQGRPDASGWTASIGLRWTLFEGLGLRAAYDALQARETAEATRARADATLQRVNLDVWTSFQSARTAGGRVATSRDLLESARASAEVATARYREGVGSIVDLLTAQTALESARAEEVRARADWLVSVAQLARTTGRLAPEGALPVPAPLQGTP